MDPLTAILGLGSTFGSLFGFDPGGRARSDQTNALNQTDALSQFFQALGLSAFDPGRQGLVNQLDTPLDANQNNIFQQLLGLSDTAQGVAAGAPELFQNANQFVDPRSLGPQATEVFDAAQQDIQNRGNTALLSQSEDRLNEFRDANRAALGPGLEAALGGILSGGRTADSTAASQAFMDIINGGGQTAGTRAMFGEGRNLVGSGGLTPALREIMGTFQSQIARGGLTPEARRALGPLQAIIDSGGQGGAVQETTQQMASLLQDAAAADHQNASEAAQAEALNRGGQAGVTVSSGLVNSGLREFRDQGLQAQADALRSAVFGQQQARQANFNAATAGAGDILRNATALLASANSGLGSVAGASSQNLATGAGLMSDAERTASANLGLGIGGFNQNFANEIANLNASGDIFGTLGSLFNQSELGSAQGLLDIQNTRFGQQNAAAGQLLGLGDQALTARGQTQQSAANQLNSVLAALGLAGQSLGEGGSLATSGRNQQVGAASTLLGGGNSLLSNLTALSGQRNNLLNPGGQQFGRPNFQQALQGSAAGFDPFEFFGGLPKKFGGGGNPGNGAIGG